MSWISQQRAEIDREFRDRFKTAEAFGRHLAPDDASLVKDLWLHWKSPEPFAVKHRDWYLKRWRTDIDKEHLDWYAQDINPWSHLQDCLGVRGLVAVLPSHATPNEIMAALDASRVRLPDPPARWSWTTPEILALDSEKFLAEASRRIQAMTGRALVRMCDFWSSDYVLTTLPTNNLPTLIELAHRADTYYEEDDEESESLRVLGA
jgi:hypothetical protein